MFENPRRGRQASNFTTNVPKIIDLKSSSQQIFFRKLSLGAPEYLVSCPEFTILNWTSIQELVWALSDLRSYCSWLDYNQAEDNFVWWQIKKASIWCKKIQDHFRLGENKRELFSPGDAWARTRNHPSIIKTSTKSRVRGMVYFS